MKESYKVRPSQSPWPRVMRVVGQPAGRSVHGGTAGPCIALRKPPFVAADRSPAKGEAIVMSNVKGKYGVPPMLRHVPNICVCPLYFALFPWFWDAYAGTMMIARGKRDNS